MTDIKAIDDEYAAHTYARFPVTLLCGKGSLAYDDKGREYIDMGAGIGVTSFGYSDDEWLEAVTEQAATLQHTSNLYYTEPAAKLAQMLCRKTGMKKVFFCNSGAEANECAIKAARKYAAEKKGPDCYNIITIKNSFHGRTLATLAATGQEHYHELFTPLAPGFLYAEPDDIHGVMRLCEENSVAAIMFECIQGEGGVIPLDKGFVQDLAAFAAKEDIILIVDEVQSGNGRTGALYSYMNYNIKPDVVSTAKGLGGGLPIGACMLGDKVKDVFAPGDNGSTFGGNPVVCAGALTILKRLDDDFLDKVKEKGEYMFKAFTGAKGIRSVSGMGMMVGLETEKPASEVVGKCLEKGVLCLTAKNKVRLLPALTIPMKDLEKAVDIIKNVCAEDEA
jgi:acetylornithine/N-succinyldiaminopimelate aminotransferase